MTVAAAVGFPIFSGSPVITDGAVDDQGLAAASNMDSAAPGSSRNCALVSTDRAVKDLKRSASGLNPSPISAGKPRGCLAICEVVYDRAGEDSQIPAIADSSTSIGLVIPDLGIQEDQITYIADSSPSFFFDSRVSMLDCER
jgi:hypothetical protein